MTSLALQSRVGEVVLDDAEVRITDGEARVTGVVDAGTWDRVLGADLFGAASRPTDGVLPADGGTVRIELRGSESDLGGGAPHAENFTIFDAARALGDVPGGMEAWIGVRFRDPGFWGPATETLAESGFGPTETSAARSVLVDGAGVRVELSADPDAGLASVLVARPCPHSIDSPSVACLLNLANARLLAGAYSVEGGELLVRSAFPVVEGSPVDVMLEALADGLVELAGMVAGALDSVVGGASPEDALAGLFG